MFLAASANLDMPPQNALKCTPTATETQEYQLLCRRRLIHYSILRTPSSQGQAAQSAVAMV
jgi:hypothetical protein